MKHSASLSDLYPVFQNVHIVQNGHVLLVVSWCNKNTSFWKHPRVFVKWWRKTLDAGLSKQESNMPAIISIPFIFHTVLTPFLFLYFSSCILWSLFLAGVNFQSLLWKIFNIYDLCLFVCINRECVDSIDIIRYS